MTAPETVEAAAAELRRARVDSVLLTFCRVLERAGGMDDVWYFLGRPEKWAAEYRAWCEHGQPADESEPGWVAFLGAIEEREA